MKPGAMYSVARSGQQYGPYTLDQLRDYFNQGSVQPTDLVWSAGMATWIPVTDVLTPGAAPAAPPPLNAEAPHALPLPSPSVPLGEDVAAYPMPPSLHWALVLLFAVLTCGLFSVVWMFIQAAWVRRIDPTCKALFVLAVGIPLQFILSIGSGLAGGGEGKELLNGLALVAGLVTTIWSYFWMRSAIEDRFDLDLSGLMTFFFNVLYLQYHMTRIAKGEHAPRWQSVVR
jgi:uncharacterized protein DUF4339